MADDQKENKLKRSSLILYILLVVIYLAASLGTPLAASSQRVVMIGKKIFPIAVLPGVLSSSANICIICLVVFFDRLGFVTSLILLVVQSPIFVSSVIVQPTLSSLPGMFSNLLTIMAIVLIHKRNKKIDEYQKIEVEYLREQQKFSQHLFEQTATALVNAVDAKDTYSHGHSLRVAEYSEKIARMMGKSDEECYRIYYTGLLHDVGKIGIDDSIINKNGKLTKEEYEVIKQHPTMGNQILSSIREYPYLSLGAHYHHERYDGKGYPDGLKGEDIPEIARIISVADAYDAMTSNRSYRDAIPQQLVREEIVKGAGTQFDPTMAEIMQKIIDTDVDYKLREKRSVAELNGKESLRCEEYRSEISEGIILTSYPVKISFKYIRENSVSDTQNGPAMVLFDSLDARVHSDPKAVKDLNYYEYCELQLEGNAENKGARKVSENENIYAEARPESSIGEKQYSIVAVKYKDHVLIKTDNGAKITETTIALPDSSRYAYIGLTGEHCSINELDISRAEEPVGADCITRIAEEISYIDGNVGDIPNVQVDGLRSDSSMGIPITDGLTLSFHAKSLPTSRLIWHCPYISIFHSYNGTTMGDEYREYALIRLDGESMGNQNENLNKLVVNRTEDFEGWDEWKKFNKDGFDSVVRFERKGNVIVTITENFGLSIRNTTTINDGTEDIYVSLTGDQCALTNIRITQP